MDNVSCGVQTITISLGKSRMLRATALEVLERTLDEIARNNWVTSRSEKMMRGLEPEQLCALCANCEISGCACASSKTVVPVSLQ